MDLEFDDDLTSGQWETLKALRLPVADRGLLDRRTVASLVILLLAAPAGDHFTITPKGRSVLLRGSPRLWDVAA
jgi:hypothetical protein